MNDLSHRLLDRTAALTHALMQAEHAHLTWATLNTQHDEREDFYRAQVADEDGFSNETKRKAEVRRRLETNWPDLLADLKTAELNKFTTNAEVERITQEVKSLRAVLIYEAALQDAETAAQSTPALPRIRIGQRQY